MNELMRVKLILETQIESTKEMVEQVKVRKSSQSTHLNIYIAELEAKIQAWKTTLKLVEQEISQFNIVKECLV